MTTDYMSAHLIQHSSIRRNLQLYYVFFYEDIMFISYEHKKTERINSIKDHH